MIDLILYLKPGRNYNHHINKLQNVYTDIVYSPYINDLCKLENYF